MENKTYYPPEVLRLMELGRQKKLWALEIMYTVQSNHTTAILRKHNLDDVELMKERDAMFRYGIQTPIAPGHWKIICPIDIISVDLYRQDNYVPEKYRSTVNPEPLNE